MAKRQDTKHYKAGLRIREAEARYAEARQEAMDAEMYRRRAVDETVTARKQLEDVLRDHEGWVETVKDRDMRIEDLLKENEELRVKLNNIDKQVDSLLEGNRVLREANEKLTSVGPEIYD